MKSLSQFISEKLIIKKRKYNYFPKTTRELKNIVKQRIKDEGNEVDLNDIDVSKITDMSDLFDRITYFNGDVSDWDVSNVEDMFCMFNGCENFNQDISNWNVSNVKNMSWMFSKCKSFNQNIFNWDVSNVTGMDYMFYDCNNFNQDISGWDVSKVKNNYETFKYCPIEEKYKPKFK